MNFQYSKINLTPYDYTRYWDNNISKVFGGTYADADTGYIASNNTMGCLAILTMGQRYSEWVWSPFEIILADRAVTTSYIKLDLAPYSELEINQLESMFGTRDIYYYVHRFSDNLNYFKDRVDGYGTWVDTTTYEKAKFHKNDTSAYTIIDPSIITAGFNIDTRYAYKVEDMASGLQGAFNPYCYVGMSSDPAIATNYLSVGINHFNSFTDGMDIPRSLVPILKAMAHSNSISDAQFKRDFPNFLGVLPEHEILYTGSLNKNSGIFQSYVKVDSEITFGNTPIVNPVHTVYEWLNDVSGELIPIPLGLKTGDETWYKIWLSAYDDNLTNINQPIKSELLIEYPHRTSTMKCTPIPILKLIKNTDAYKDYINHDSEGDTNFKYKIVFQSFNRHYDIGWESLIVPVQRMQETLNGSTFLTDPINEIELNIKIPLSHSDDSDNIVRRQIGNITINMDIPYSYKEDVPADEPLDINQNPTPPDPFYDTDPPNIEDDPEAEYPIGTVHDSMTSEVIMPTTTPLMEVTALYTIYELTSDDIKKLGHFLWSTSWYENLYLINNTPLENILSLKVCMFDLLSGRNTQIKLLNVPVEYMDYTVGERVIVTGNLVSENIIETIGQFEITGKYNSFLDLNPFTECRMYLPAVGFVDLDANMVNNHTCTLTVYIDALTLIAKYQLVNDENMIVGEWEFNSAYDLPLTATNKAQAEFSIIGNLAKSVGEAMTLDVGSALGDLINAIPQYHTSTSGSISSNTAMMTSRMAYLEISRPMWQSNLKYNHTVGRVCNQTYQLGLLKGFTQIESGSDLSGINTTSTELDMIRSLLESGVIL